MTRRPAKPTVDRPDVHRVISDDELLTRLAQGAGSAPQSGPHEGAALTAESLLVDWRARVVAQELPTPPSAKAIARAARLAGISAPGRSSSFRAAVGIVASVAFLLSGTAIAGARSAQPGDVLWPVTRTFWADRADATMAEHDIDAALTRAAVALAAGDEQGANQALAAAAAALPRIPQDVRADLLVRLQQVSAGVSDPLPPAAQAAGPAGTPPAIPGFPAGTGGPAPAVDGRSNDRRSDGTALTGIGDVGGTPVGAGTAATDPARTAVGSDPSESGSGTAAPGTSSASGTDGSSTDPASGMTTGASPTPTTAAPSSTAPSTSSPSTTTPSQTSTPATTGPSSTGPSSTGSSSTGTSTSSTVPTTTSPSTSSPGDTTAPSSTDPAGTGFVTSDAVAPPTTVSRRTTQSPPGFAPPPGTTPATRAGAPVTPTTTAASATPTTSAPVAR